MKHINYSSYYDSPIGIININTSEDNIFSLYFVDEEIDEDIESPLSIKVKEELDAYFNGNLTSFSLYNYFISGLEKRVLDIVSNIPYGETMTYKEVARLLGNEDIVDPVITVLNNNPCPILLPCHRVVKDDYDVGSYVFDITIKEYLLLYEKLVKRAM